MIGNNVKFAHKPNHQLVYPKILQLNQKKG